MIAYVDASAALKLLIEETESESLADYLTTAVAGGDRLVSSMLLYTELHCAAQRRAQLPAESVNMVLNSIDLIDVSRSDLMYAAALSGGLRSADSIHLAAAIRVQADIFVAYDKELLATGAKAGLTVSSPGAIC